MASLTLPNKWGEEGFNVIRNALIEYCAEAGTPVDLGYAFQWDTSVPLIRHAEGMTDDEFRNCDTALSNIVDYLHQGMDPWAAVTAAKKDWARERQRVADLLRQSDDEKS